MSTTLSLLAVQNAAVLRALAAPPVEGWSSYAELAAHLQRDASNLSKTLSKLEEGGLAAFNPLQHGLTAAGQQQLAMIGRAEGADEPGSQAAVHGDILWLTHAEIQPDPDNARRDWNSEEARDALDALRSDIVQNGLLQNLVVRSAGAEGEPYILVGGERRWRAIGEAITDGDIEVDTPLPCRLLETDELGFRLAALAENLQRRNLNPIEKAKAFEGLADAGLSNKEIADRVSSTPEHIQQHRRFLQLDETDQQRMTLPKDDPSHLSVRDARAKLARKPEADAAAAAKAEMDAKVTPEVRLAMAEFFHRLRNEATYTYADLAVAHDARTTTLAAKLVELGWLHFSDTPKNYGDQIGHYTARLSHDPQLFDWQNSADADIRTAGLTALYSEQGKGQGIPNYGYVTDWISAPTLTPEGEALVAAAETNRIAAEAIRAEHQAQQAARAEKWASARAAHAALLNTDPASEAETVQSVTASTAEAVEHPLPWSFLEDGVILDANGDSVMRVTATHWMQASERDIAIAQIMVLSVNRAAGLATPPMITEEAEAAIEEGEAA